MLTGHPPWFEPKPAGAAPAGGFAVFQLLYMIAESAHPPPMPSAQEMPEGLHELLQACFERDTAKRPGSSELMLLGHRWIYRGAESEPSNGE